MKTVIANFKSNKNKDEFQLWMKEYLRLEKTVKNVKVILAPPYVDLEFCGAQLQTSPPQLSTEIASQDISSFPSGSYTGAISTHNLVGFHVTHVICGHSERRKYFHETVLDINNKIHEILTANMTPIVCVTHDEIYAQANLLEEQDKEKVMVTFEPTAHIGTGTTETLEEILRTKQDVITAFGNVSYMYGGSVDLNTNPAILHSKEIEGFLVGTASLDPTTFISLLHKISSEI